MEDFDWCKTIIMLDKVDGFIRDYNGNNCLVLFGPEKYDAIFDRRYSARSKINITVVNFLQISNLIQMMICI